MPVPFVMSTAPWRGTRDLSPNSFGPPRFMRWIRCATSPVKWQQFECRTDDRPVRPPGTPSIFIFKAALKARIDVLPTAGMVEETYDLSGEDFHVSVTCPFGRKRGWLAYRNGALVTEEWASSDMPEDILNGCYDETAAFIRALRDRSVPKPSIADVAPSVEICMSIAKQQIGR